MFGNEFHNQLLVEERHKDELRRIERSRQFSGTSNTGSIVGLLRHTLLLLGL